jgi:hypothetical protein
MMMTQINTVKEFAVAQFGELNVPEYNEVLERVQAAGGHWYLFDETADKAAEIADLKIGYNIVLEVK